MKRNAYILVFLVILAALTLSACGGGAATEEQVTVPEEYAGMTNPHAGDQASADAGQAIYAQNCVSCHGETGAGDGPAAESLDPKPTNLADTAANQNDDYIFWRISEGGAMEPFNSSMPAWKGTLSEDQIWQVVTYIQTLD